MVMNVNFSKESISQLLEKMNNYFATLAPDEMIAWVVIGIGFLLFVIGVVF